MYEALVARVRYHIQKAEFMGLKDAESTLLLKDASIAIEQLETLFPCWIPVSKKFPDGRDSVLALTRDCDIYVCDYIPSVKQFWTIPGDELHIDDITHWMPLPQPPEEG